MLSGSKLARGTRARRGTADRFDSRDPFTIVVRFVLILRLREGTITFEGMDSTLILLGLFSTTLYQNSSLYGVKYAAASDDSIVIGRAP